MIKIFYSPKSRKDLDRIYDYIYDDLNNTIAAEKTVKGILNKIGEIKEYPRLGPVWYLENNIDSGFRFLICDNYIIFYKNTKEAFINKWIIGGGVLSKIYINKTYLYSKKNIVGFELLDKENKDFRKLLHYEEAIEYIKSLGGKIENAQVFIKNKNDLGKNIYDIKVDGQIIFNLSVLYNEREKYYDKYKDLIYKFICILNL